MCKRWCHISLIVLVVIVGHLLILAQFYYSNLGKNQFAIPADPGSIKLINILRPLELQHDSILVIPVIPQVPEVVTCNRSCTIISWQREGGFGNQLDTLFPNLAAIMNLGCCIAPPEFRAYHGHGDDAAEAYASYSDLFNIEELCRKFPGQVHKNFNLFRRQGNFCTCPENNISSPYQGKFPQLGYQQCERSCMSILSEVKERLAEEKTKVHHYLNVEPSILQQLQRSLSDPSVPDYQTFRQAGLRLCPVVTDYTVKLIQAMSYGSEVIEQKVTALRNSTGEIHGTAHIRQGDYYHLCETMKYDGCAPDWPRYIKQLKLACLAVGIPVDGICRVFIGTEGNLGELPQYGCDSQPKIEFVCESCETTSRPCLQVIQRILFESKPEWLHSGFGGGITDQIVMFNNGRGFFIGNQYSSFSASVFRKRVAQAVTDNKTTTLGVWSPKSGQFQYPKSTPPNSTYYCDSWGNILDRFRP